MDKSVQQALDDLRQRVQNVAVEHGMRAPCRFCGCLVGRIRPSSNQDCVYCRDCGRFQYNAPRTETGREQRTLQSVRHVTPSQRSRVLERAHSRCETCGRDGELTMGHILSVKDGFDFLTDVQLNSDENLIAQCAECNSGQGVRALPLWLLAGILYRRSK